MGSVYRQSFGVFMAKMNATRCTAARKVFYTFLVINTGSIHILSEGLLQAVGMFAHGQVKRNTVRDWSENINPQHYD
jgi:hypothetical protein